MTYLLRKQAMTVLAHAQCSYFSGKRSKILRIFRTFEDRAIRMFAVPFYFFAVAISWILCISSLEFGIKIAKIFDSGCWNRRCCWWWLVVGKFRLWCCLKFEIFGDACGLLLCDFFCLWQRNVNYWTETMWWYHTIFFVSLK